MQVDEEQSDPEDREDRDDRDDRGSVHSHPDLDHDPEQPPQGEEDGEGRERGGV